MSIQSIFIKDTETRGTGSKSYTVYRITVQGAVRSWQIWRRYSEFATLHHDLIEQTTTPPAPLPPKHTFSILPVLGRGSSDSVIEERRTGLETYLRAILASKDPQWRDTFLFKDFLGVPVGKNDPTGSSSSSGGAGQFTSSSWLDEHTDLQTLVRDVRADINKRDALATRGETSTSHSSNVQAKKKLAALITRLDVLGRGLQVLAMGGMSEGEVQRRGDMVARLQDDCASLGKMVIAAHQLTSSLGSSSANSRPWQHGAAERNPAGDADRNALFSLPGMPGASDTGNKPRPVTRVFGQKAPPQETDQTRPLDEGGLAQLQQVQMDNQDAQLNQLTAILQRQKHLGMAIHSEIEQQNEMLDGLLNDVDSTSSRLGNAKKHMNQLNS